MKVFKKVPLERLDSNLLYQDEDFYPEMEEYFYKENHDKSEEELGVKKGDVYHIRYNGSGKKIKESFGLSRKLKLVSFSFFADKDICFICYNALFQDVRTLEYVELDPSNNNFSHRKAKPAKTDRI